MREEGHHVECASWHRTSGFQQPPPPHKEVVQAVPAREITKRLFNGCNVINMYKTIINNCCNMIGQGVGPTMARYHFAKATSKTTSGGQRMFAPLFSGWALWLFNGKSRILLFSRETAGQACFFPVFVRWSKAMFFANPFLAGLWCDPVAVQKTWLLDCSNAILLALTKRGPLWAWIGIGQASFRRRSRDLEVKGSIHGHFGQGAFGG